MRKVIKAKARAFTIAIEKMDEKERQHAPGHDFGEDYNNLRNLALELDENLNRVLPPPVTFFSATGGRSYSNQSYAEISVYCEQIYQILNASVHRA